MDDETVNVQGGHGVSLRLLEETRGVQELQGTEHHDDGRRGPEPSDRATTVAGIRKGVVDERDQEIQRIFFRRPNYVIYSAESRVAVQFSDTTEEATRQIMSIAELLPLRDQLLYLAQGLPKDKAGHDGAWSCSTQIADALRLGLESKLDMARDILKGAIDEVTSLLQRDGRVCYLKASTIAMLWFLVTAGTAALVANGFKQTIVSQLLAAACSGAVGAMFSIAIGIRNRTVAIDGDVESNRTEAYLRVLIGIISGIGLYLIISSGILGGTNWLERATDPWQATILIGLAAGFVERLVPDLLEKTAMRLNSAEGNDESKPSPARTGGS